MYRVSTVLPSSPGSRRRIAVVTAMISLLLFLAVVATVLRSYRNGFHVTTVLSSAINDLLPASHRKLLRTPKKVDKPARFWGDTVKCAGSDLLVSQGPGAPLPSGIPTYIVEIVNACVSGCDISDINLRCGWFSSARLIDPHVFKRIHYNDCLVNDGRPLLNGESISFQYANTHSYPLSISSMSCS